MKKNLKVQLLILISCFYLNSLKTSAQVVEVVSGLSTPYGLAIDQASHLYMSQSGATNGNKISFIVLDDINPILSDLFINLNTPTRLKVSTDQYLYVCESSAITNRISRANLGSATFPVMVPYITGLITPFGLDIKDNNIYVGEISSWAIKKINTATNPFQSSTLINDLATDIIIDGEFIYYTNPTSGKVYSNTIINPSLQPGELVTGITNPSSIMLDNGILYISDSTNGKIYRANIQGSSTFASEIVSGLNNPQSMIVFNNDLYIAESGANRVVKFNLSNLSNENFVYNFSATIFPNPSQNILNIKSEETINEIAVFDMLGKKVATNQVSTNAIDVSNLGK